jgi:molybdate transport system substrate-binding protein
MKKLPLFLSFLLIECTMHAQEVNVAIAANLSTVMEEIAIRYNKIHPNVHIRVTPGASGVLAQQVIQGAKFDFFMSADSKYPGFLHNAGYTRGDIKIYGYGKLVIWSSTVDVSGGMEALNKANVVRIAIAKPEISPFGERTLQCLKYYKMYDKLKNKLVYAGNIAQAAQYAQTGNTEIAFLAYTLLFDEGMKNRGSYYIPDSKSYLPIEQACVLLKTGDHYQEAEQFMNFVLSSTCKSIFDKYGITTP